MEVEDAVHTHPVRRRERDHQGSVPVLSSGHSSLLLFLFIYFIFTLEKSSDKLCHYCPVLELRLELMHYH